MTRFVRLLVVVVLAVLSAACGGGGGGEVVDLGDPASLGQRTFAQWCAPCHGPDGEGHINQLDAPALNAAGDSHLLTDAEILDGIIKGGSETDGSMTPLGQFLVEEQEMAVLYYVHTLWTDEQRLEHETNEGHTPPTPAN